MNHLAKDISRVRTRLLIKYPFWGMLSLNLKVKADDSIPTMSTDGQSLFVNPDYWASLDEDLKMSEIAHEVFHCAFGHLWRRENRIKSVYNVACDIVADYHLQKGGLQIVRHSVIYTMGRCCDPSKSVEEVYNELLQACDQQDDDAGLGITQGDASDEAKPKLSMFSKYNDLHNWGDDASKEAEIKWKTALLNAVTAIGDVPNNIRELVDSFIHPRVNWRACLRELLMAARSDYRWLPPNKKFSANGTILPSLAGERIEIIFAVDTSGSMTSDDMKAALSEIMSIRNTFEDYRLWVVQADYDVQSVEEVDATSPDVDRVQGRGGTRLLVGEIYDHVVRLGGSPNCMVYFTDGWGDIEGYCPIPIIWLVVGGSDFKPPFGMVVKYER